MKVLVTGGTGYIGSHAVKALVEAGHTPRVLVRRPDRTALDALGCGEVEVVGGDVTDPIAVRGALKGCEAVLHSGSVYSLDPRDAGQIRATNVTGTEVVLGAARDAGCDPIVHLSSTSAMLPADGVLTCDASPKDSGYVYAQSKADSERVARRLQADGAPVVSVCAGWVWGPHDLRLGESSRMLRDLLGGTMRLGPPGRTSLVDVRDLATLLARTLEPGRGPRRYLAAGSTTTFPELASTLARVTDRRVRVAVLPRSVALIGGACADLVRSRVGPRLPASGEGGWLFMNGPETDDGTTWTGFGIERRGMETTIADQVRWLCAHGVVSARQAGRLGA